MNKVLLFIRYNSPVFLYSVSLFVIINIFGRICSTLLSLAIFAISSLGLIVIFSRCINGTTVLLKNKIFCIVIVLSQLLSICTEAGIAVEVINGVSDLNSGYIKKAIFAVIIIIIAFLISKNGKETVFKISNILFFIPIILVISAVSSAVKNGLDFSSLFILSNNIALEIFGGVLASLILIPDSIIIYKMQKSSGNFNKCTKYSLISGVLYILLFDIFFKTVLGNSVYTSIASPYFAVSGTAGGAAFDEITLIIYSLCLLYRFSCKVTVINNFLESCIKSWLWTSSVAFLLTAVFAFGGVLLSAFVSEPVRLFFICALINIFCLIIFIAVRYKNNL